MAQGHRRLGIGLDRVGDRATRCITASAPGCGIESYAEGKGPDGSEMVGIKLRCVEGVDVAKLSPKQIDCRSR